jgi:hypothetical protein
LFGGLIAFVVLGIREFQKLRKQIEPLVDRAKPLMEDARPIMASAHQVVNQVNQAVAHDVKPILGNVQEITHKAGVIVSDLGSHAHEIAQTGEQTVKGLTHKVGATGEVIADNVSKPVIRIASALTGVGRALTVLKNYKAGEEELHRDGHSRANGDGAKRTAGDRI